MRVHTRGWLPYTLQWQFRVTERNYPHGFTLEAWGDFFGSGRWRFEQDGAWVDVIYDWRVRADKPILSLCSRRIIGGPWHKEKNHSPPN